MSQPRNTVMERSEANLSVAELYEIAEFLDIDPSGIIGSYMQSERDRMRGRS